MNKSIKLNKNTLPKFEYKSDNPNLYIDGNIVSQSIFDRISPLAEIYALMLPVNNMNIHGFDTSDISEIRNYAIEPDDVETMENTITLDILLSVMPDEFQQLFGLITGNASFSVLYTAFLSIVYAIENGMDINGLSELALQAMSLNENLLQSEESQNILLQFVEFFKTNAHKFVRFSGVKLQVLIPFLDPNNDEWDVYAITECDTLIDRIKFVHYDVSQIEGFEELSLDSADIDLDIVRLLYKQPNMQRHLVFDLLPIYYVGEFTTYATIHPNSDYDIKINGFSNEYGSFSNVKTVSIVQNFPDELKNATNNTYRYSLKYTGSKEVIKSADYSQPYNKGYDDGYQDFKNENSENYSYNNPYSSNDVDNYDLYSSGYTDGFQGASYNTAYFVFDYTYKYYYKIYGLELNPAFIGITPNFIPVQYINEDNTIELNGNIVSLTSFSVTEHNGEQLIDVTEFFNEYSNKTGENILKINLHDDASNVIPDDSYIYFTFENSGKLLESFANDDSENKHDGTYTYTIPENSETTLTINYMNFNKPNIRIISGGTITTHINEYNINSGGCLIAGTQILMADGSTKAIEDIQIGEKVMDQFMQPQTVFWNEPMDHDPADYYISYEFPDGRKIGIIADERIWYNGKYENISVIPGLKSTRIDEVCKSYEIWCTGNDTFYANGVVCAKIYSRFKNKYFRWILQQLYRIVFLHRKNYKFIIKFHKFVSEKILKHKIV